METPTQPMQYGEGKRSRILEGARLLFWEQGYENTTLADVAERTQANLGSVYYFFHTKEDLLLGVLDLYTELLFPVLIRPLFERVKDPLERIFGLLDGYRQGLLLSGCTQGCPIGNLALEVGDAMPKARAKIAANFEGWRGWVRKCLEDAKDRLPPDADIHALAVFILTVMEGAVMQARAHQSLEPFDASVLQLRDYFDRLQGPKPKNRPAARPGKRKVARR
ncbi:MAG TPA: TetR family transcriptional regulator C-terminal domain-containing protein [Terriglobia bacterium]|nr:TetR family transcriptional regulator C-terminal domain-containing protein [Terriglobia bacterium]